MTRIKCPVSNCGKFFLTRDGYEAHLRTHEGLRPYPCPFPFCGKSFDLKGNMKAHVALHKDGKPHLCEFGNCGKSFRQIANLRLHLRTCHNVDVSVMINRSRKKNPSNDNRTSNDNCTSTPSSSSLTPTSSPTSSGQEDSCALSSPASSLSNSFELSPRMCEEDGDAEEGYSGAVGGDHQLDLILNSSLAGLWTSAPSELAPIVSLPAAQEQALFQQQHLIVFDGIIGTELLPPDHGWESLLLSGGEAPAIRRHWAWSTTTTTITRFC